MNVKTCAALIVSGLGVGWLSGLAETGIASTLLTALLALVSSAAILALGLREDRESTFTALSQVVRAVQVVPLALVVAAISVGFPFGQYARANDWFGVNLKSFATRWSEQHGDGQESVEELFKKRYGMPVSAPETPQKEASDL